MVGRGWWLLVWTVYSAWTVFVVCGGFSCQQGQEFYHSQQGRCVPCTRCHSPLVVVVPCYVYRDAVCAPAAQFLPTWSHLTRPQAPITLSTPTVTQNHTEEDHGHGSHATKSSGDGDNLPGNQRKVSGHRQGKSGTYKGHSNKKNSSTSYKKSKSEKYRKGHPKHHHRHRHSGEHTNHRAQNESVVADRSESVVSSGSVSHIRGASESVSDQNGASVSVNETRSDASDSELVTVDISQGANSDNNESTDSQESDTSNWHTHFFLVTICVFGVGVIVLIIIILSHCKNVFRRRKLKSVCDTVPRESNGELTLVERLLPGLPAVTTTRTSVTVSRSAVTFVRVTSTNSSTTVTTSPSTTMASGNMGTDAEQISGHVYPPIPFTMDRLLEQRRVLGPSSSIDTNLYIERWQQQDSQSVVQHISPLTVGHRTYLRGSVSACPSPVPVRTYRLRPASASASPIISARGLGPTQGRVRGMLLSSPVCPVSAGSGGVVVSGCPSVVPTPS